MRLFEQINIIEAYERIDDKQMISKVAVASPAKNELQQLRNKEEKRREGGGRRKRKKKRERRKKEKGKKKNTKKNTDPGVVYP